MEVPFSEMIALVAPRLEERDGYVAVWVDGSVKAPGVSVWPEEERDKAVAYAAAEADSYRTILAGYVVAKDSDGYRVYKASTYKDGHWWPQVRWEYPAYTRPLLPRFVIGARSRPSALAGRSLAQPANAPAPAAQKRCHLLWMDERTMMLPAKRNGEPIELWIRYTLASPGLSSDEIEVMDLKIDITLAQSSPAADILEGRFGRALTAGEAWSTRHNDSAIPYHWEVSGEAMSSLRHFLVRHCAIEGVLDTPPLGPRVRLSSLAG